MYTQEKISDYGTNNLIIARLVFYTQDILSKMQISKAVIDPILELMLNSLSPRLLEMDKKKNLLEKKIQEAIKEANAQNKINNTSNKTIPYVTNLKVECESFLYLSKLFLRDLSSLFDLMGYEGFSGSNYSKLSKIATQKFSTKSGITKCLLQYEPMAKRLVRMRNNVEHPKSCSNIEILNFEVKNNKLLDPVWCYEGFCEEIMSDFTNITKNLLCLAEELFLNLLLESNLLTLPITFNEIPENLRNPECPVRFQVKLLL
jgi:hypothetical protein